MNRFAECLAFVLKFEGGKVDDPKDPGGKTAYGVTQDTFTAYRMTRGRPWKDVWDISPDEVRDIYLADYWSKMQASSLPLGLDLCAFDFAVNAGIKKASLVLQRALGMEMGDLDGSIGPTTLRHVHDAIAANHVDSVITAYQQCRQDHYEYIIGKNAVLAKYAKGWTNRTNECTAAAMECRA